MDDVMRKRSTRDEDGERYYGVQAPRKRMNKKKIIHALTALVVVLSVLLVVMGAAAYSSVMNILKNPGGIVIGKGARDKGNLPNFSALPTMPERMEIDGQSKTKNKDIVSILFLGIDTSEERGQSMGYQSDMLMLAAINVKNYHTTVISIPRDTVALIDRLDSKGNVTSQRETKINAAFSNGGGRHKYSYMNARNAVNRLLGTDVQYYVGIDMDGIVAITDAVGGVPITLDADFTSADYRMEKGKTMTLNGKQAELYVRHRKLKGMSGSDIERTGRQLRFVKSFANVVKSRGASTYVLELYKQVSKYVDTNLELDEMADFASLLMKVDLDAMEMVTLPGKGDGKGNWVLDKNKMQEIIANAYYH